MHRLPSAPGIVALTAIGLACSTSGCASLLRGVREAIMGPEAHAPRTAPAREDLPGISTVAISALSGPEEEVNSVSGALGARLIEGRRFQVVERERLAAIATERGCSAADPSCLSGALPASALVVGSVSPSSYQERIDSYRYECEKDKRKTTCTTFTRKGSAHASANLRLVDAATGKVLYQAMLTKIANAEQSATDNQPPTIDAQGLTEQVRAEVAQSFFEAISPHMVDERLELMRARGFQELDEGNGHLKEMRLTEAMKAYELAVKRAETDVTIKPAQRAKALYSFGITQALNGEYPQAIASIESAIKLDDEDDYKSMLTRVRVWQSDAERTAKQLAYAEPPALPSPAPSAGVADVR